MSTNYFRNFPKTSYFFGTEGEANIVENIAIYADVIDQIRDTATTYQKYNILPDERPDQVSMKLYDTPNYYWTFFLMNDHLREQGWPLSNSKLFEFATKTYDERVLETKTPLSDKFAIGNEVEGLSSFATGTIVHRNLDLGQVWIESGNGRSFVSNEPVRTTTTLVDELITLIGTSKRINSAHHYENSDGEYVDIDPHVDRPSIYTEKTWYDELTRQNDALKSIIVIRNNLIGEIVKSFQKAVRL